MYLHLFLCTPDSLIYPPCNLTCPLYAHVSPVLSCIPLYSHLFLLFPQSPLCCHLPLLSHISPSIPMYSPALPRIALCFHVSPVLPSIPLYSHVSPIVPCIQCAPMIPCIRMYSPLLPYTFYSPIYPACTVTYLFVLPCIPLYAILLYSRVSPRSLM